MWLSPHNTDTYWHYPHGWTSQAWTLHLPKGSSTSESCTGLVVEQAAIVREGAWRIRTSGWPCISITSFKAMRCGRKMWKHDKTCREVIEKSTFRMSQFGHESSCGRAGWLSRPNVKLLHMNRGGSGKPRNLKYHQAIHQAIMCGISFFCTGTSRRT